MNVGLEGVKQEIESTTACCASTFMWNMVEASNNPHRDSTIGCLGSAFSVGFCEVTLVSERRLFWVRGSHSSYSTGSSLGGLFS